MANEKNDLDAAGRQPAGLLVLRTIAMPRDCNPNGDIFGGWLLSQMDLGGGLLAKEVAHSRVVTVTIDKMAFVKPVKVGDTVCVYAQVAKIGNTSMEIHLEVWAKDLTDAFEAERHIVTEGVFKYVAINAKGRPRPIPENPTLPPESLAV
ncbi:MAG: acyl-CoA thioester hydrolase YciA [Desulfobacterales bacterium]|nr:acyl-CoA thioester hydrolase YciA [Desulfobacterales bacterium]